MSFVRINCPEDHFSQVHELCGQKQRDLTLLPSNGSMKVHRQVFTKFCRNFGTIPDVCSSLGFKKLDLDMLQVIIKFCYVGTCFVKREDLKRLSAHAKDLGFHMLCDLISKVGTNEKQQSSAKKRKIDSSSDTHDEEDDEGSSDGHSEKESDDESSENEELDQENEEEVAEGGRPVQVTQPGINQVGNSESQMGRVVNTNTMQESPSSPQLSLLSDDSSDDDDEDDFFADIQPPSVGPTSPYNEPPRRWTVEEINILLEKLAWDTKQKIKSSNDGLADYLQLKGVRRSTEAIAAKRNSIKKGYKKHLNGKHNVKRILPFLGILEQIQF